MEKRKRILVNQAFQFKISFFILTWIVALSFVYPLIIFNMFDQFIQILSLHSKPNTLAYMSHQRDSFFWWLLAFQGTFLLMAFFVSLFMGHRIAGPIVKIKNSLLDMAKGKVAPKIQLRKNDYFQDLGDAVNVLSEKLAQVDTKTGIIKELKLASVASTQAPDVDTQAHVAQK